MLSNDIILKASVRRNEIMVRFSRLKTIKEVIDKTTAIRFTAKG